MTRRKQRITAIVCFYMYFFSGKDLDQIISDFFEYFVDQDNSQEYAMFDEQTKQMIHDAIKSQHIIIDHINKHLKKGWTFDRLGLMERAILFMAISEMVYQVDDKAIIINEAIEISKIYADEDSYKMINAVLDQL